MKEEKQWYKTNWKELPFNFSKFYSLKNYYFKREHETKNIEKHLD